MRIDRNSLGIRLLLPISGLLLIIALIGFIAVYTITRHIEEDYHQFSAATSAASVKSILEMAAADLIAAKLAENPVVVEAKKKGVIEAINSSWTLSRQNGVITSSNGQVLASTLSPDLTALIVTNRIEGTFSVDRKGIHFLCISTYFPLWNWNVITVTEHSSGSLKRREVFFLLPGLLVAILLQAIGLYLVLRRNLQQPVAAVITNIELENDIGRTGITELDKIGTAVNDAFWRVREQTAELESELGERMRAEAEVREKEGQVRLLLQSTAEGIYGIDMTGTCTFCNPSAVHMLGYAKEEDLLGKKIHTLIHHTRYDGSIYPAKKCKAYEAYRSNTQVHVDDEIFWRADGSSFPVEYWSYPIVELGTVQGAVVTFIDISRRRQAEATLQKSEIKYRELFDHAGDAIFITTLSGQMLDVNEVACERLGYSREELMTLTPMDIDSPDQAVHVPARIESLKRRGSLIFETIHKRKDGTGMPTEVASRIIEFENKPAILSTARDISERRKLEDQLRQSQKMESIGTLAGGVAHDFNNILTAIIGYGSISLMNMEKNDANRLNIEQILAAAERAANLTKDMLLFSRKQAIEKKPVDLNEIVRKMEKFLRRVIGEDISVKTVISDRPLPVLADEHQIGQVLMNLSVNARDAMRKGGLLTITAEEIVLDSQFVSLHGYGEPGRHALITVSDTGEGMDEQTRLKIFEPFFTTKEVGKGTGLGLAVVYGIVQQHGGYISVSSQPGAGTSFRIYQPLIAADIGKEGNNEAAAYPEGGSETILLAEDDEALRKMTGSLLVSLGYKVIVASDGEDALQKFKEHQEEIDLLLFDIIMPNKSGQEAYAEISTLRPGIRIIFVSGYSPDIIHNKIAFADNVTIVYKPVLPADLLRKVRSVLDNGKGQ
ncbi:MAG: hybrid sensor histidine kinase/response regulator [Thermodesulfovibrio sp.]|nr:hybrid sensor histidine kinase/response regulator [Thermodesulfovibrio sp.]